MVLHLIYRLAIGKRDIYCFLFAHLLQTTVETSVQSLQLASGITVSQVDAVFYRLSPKIPKFALQSSTPICKDFFAQ